MGAKDTISLFIFTVLLNLLLHTVVIWIAWTYFILSIPFVFDLPEVTFLQAAAIRALIMAVTHDGYISFGSRD